MRIEEEQVNAFISTAYCDCEKPLLYIQEIHNDEKHVFQHFCVDCKKFFELVHAYPITML